MVTTLPQQIELDLKVEKEVEIDGVAMGVLSDGTPYLTGRGLARLCGVDSANIVKLAAEWDEPIQKPRITKIKDMLVQRGMSATTPYITLQDDKTINRVWVGDVCLAVLEYYAFDVSQAESQTALKNYRILAGRGFQEFVYAQVGYDPNKSIPEAWRQFHDRVSLTYNAVPAGYFGIFKEIADMIVTLGQAGLHIDEKFVPDISVGRTWSEHWVETECSKKYGERAKFEHNFPDYFPQAASNPQEPWCYPEAALGEFRRWFREQYIGQGKFANYIIGQAKKKALPASFAQLAIAAYEEKKDVKKIAAQ